MITTQPTHTVSPTPLERDELADRAVASLHAMAAGTLDDLRALVHPEAVNREASTEPPSTRGQGPEAFWATALWLRAAYSDLSFSVSTVVVEEDLVVTHGEMSGRHTGNFVVWTPDGTVDRAFAPTGRTFAVHHAHFLRFRDGLISEHWAVRDDQTQAVQLGWLPPSLGYLLRCGLATRRERAANR